MSVLLCAKNNSIHVTGIEIQPDVAHMAQKSVVLNGLQSRICIIQGDLKEIGGIVSPGADVVVANPPYYQAGAGKAGGNAHVNIAKREVKCTLLDVVSAASRTLRTGGTVLYGLPDRPVCGIDGIDEKSQAGTQTRQTGDAKTGTAPKLCARGRKEGRRNGR